MAYDPGPTIPPMDEIPRPPNNTNSNRLEELLTIINEKDCIIQAQRLIIEERDKVIRELRNPSNLRTGQAGFYPNPHHQWIPMP